MSSCKKIAKSVLPHPQRGKAAPDRRTAGEKILQLSVQRSPAQGELIVPLICPTYAIQES